MSDSMHSSWRRGPWSAILFDLFSFVFHGFGQSTTNAKTIEKKTKRQTPCTALRLEERSMESAIFCFLEVLVSLPKVQKVSTVGHG